MITKLKLKLKNGEVIKLNKVRSLSFGIISGDRWETKEDLYINSDRGQLDFQLDEIMSIDFMLEQKEKSICLLSKVTDKEDE